MLLAPYMQKQPELKHISEGIRTGTMLELKQDQNMGFTWELIVKVACIWIQMMGILILT